jgi:hypothetical protein
MRSARPVVWISHQDSDRCTGCGREIMRGALIQLHRELGLRCLACAGLADLEYLPAGDTALTRRALALPARTAVVVKFSRARRRNERQGVLVDPQALARAREECEKDAARREAEQGPRRARAERREQEYVVRFARTILDLFPGCPGPEAEAIARRACEKYTGRVGRSRAAKVLDEEAVTLAVRAHVRHRHTRYDEILAQGLEPFEVRPLVAAEIEELLARWREGANKAESGEAG